MIQQNDKEEFLGQVIDTFEDFLDEKGVVLPNKERDEDEDLAPEESANIYGSDYDLLHKRLEAVFIRWDIMI